MGDSRLLKVVGLFGLLGVISYSLIIGLENKQDPVWIEIDSLMHTSNIQTLEDSAALQALFVRIQKDEEVKTYSSQELLAEALSFFPMMEMNKLNKFMEPLLKDRKITISGVSGAGNTTLVKILSRLVSGSIERELEISCVQNFELKLYDLYIGEVTKSSFEKGLLIDFFETANHNPQHNYCVVIDNIDKITPETLFGPVMWNELDDSEDVYSNKINEYEIKIPKNIYIISVMHSGVGSVNRLTYEHFRRLGDIHFNSYNYHELYLFLYSKADECKISIAHLKNLLYFFIKANEYIAKNYSDGHTLGQWSNINKAYREEDFGKFIQYYIDHVNAFKPAKPIRKEDFDQILYSIENNGLLKSSSFLATLGKNIVDFGLFTEFIAGLLFLIITSLFGKIIIDNKRRKIQKMMLKIDLRLNGNVSAKDYSKIYDEESESILESFKKGKINFQEETFLQNYLQQKLKRIPDFKA